MGFQGVGVELAILEEAADQCAHGAMQKFGDAGACTESSDTQALQFVGGGQSVPGQQVHWQPGFPADGGDFARIDHAGGKESIHPGAGIQCGAFQEFFQTLFGREKILEVLFSQQAADTRQTIALLIAHALTDLFTRGRILQPDLQAVEPDVL